MNGHLEGVPQPYDLYMFLPFPFGCISQVNPFCLPAWFSESARLRWMRSFPNPQRSMCWRMTCVDLLFLFFRVCHSRNIFFFFWEGAAGGIFEYLYIYIYIYARTSEGYQCLKWSKWLLLRRRNITPIHISYLFLCDSKKETIPGKTDMIATTLPFSLSKLVGRRCGLTEPFLFQTWDAFLRSCSQRNFHHFPSLSCYIPDFV